MVAYLVECYNFGWLSYARKEGWGGNQTLCQILKHLFSLIDESGIFR